MSFNLNEIKKLLIKFKVDGLIVSSTVNIQYLTNYSNFSRVEREAFLLLTENKKYLFTDGRYTEEVNKKVKDFEVVEKEPNDSLIFSIQNIIAKLKLKKIGFEGDNLTFLEFKQLQSKNFKLENINFLDLRVIKDKKEIDLIKKACKLGDLAFENILKKIKPNITEEQLVFEFEMFVKSKGGKLAFDSIVAFGKNSSIPHFQTSKNILKSKKGQFILFDLGVELDSYCSDMTRTVFFGKPNEKQLKMYQVVLESQHKAAEFLQNQLLSKKIVTGIEVDKVARDCIKSFGFPNIPHGLGHGVGIEVHEAPRLSPLGKNTLESGMVFSIEPGIYIEGFGGVRIEDLFVIEGKSLKKLTNSSSEIIII